MTNPEIVDVAVVGAGVVGLAVARACARAGLETIILEQHDRIGSETSSRNSGVIHSGIYYPAGSLKAQLCIEGRRQLYDYCAAKGIAHRRCGKLIVAQGSQVESLHELHTRGVANGVTDLQWLDAEQARALEPEVRCAAALLSPSTGIVDPHELMTALLGDAEAAGAILVRNTRVESIAPGADGLQVATRSGSERGLLQSRWAINSAGLDAVGLLQHIEGYPVQSVPSNRYAKGNYFSCTGRPFQRLVYPMPDEAGLGIHATIDLDGSTRFGPDVEWTADRDYRVNPERADVFYQSIREYWPGLPDGALQPAHAGIRPKLTGPGEPAADFVIEGPADHGVAGLINLLGIESPGLTSALAIGARTTALTRA